MTDQDAADLWLVAGFLAGSVGGLMLDALLRYIRGEL